MSDHAEAIALAERLAGVEPDTAGDCRRALLLYWFGSGASRLRLEEDAAIRAELSRLSAGIAAVASDRDPSPEAIRAIGVALDALVRPPAGAPSPRRA
jgi:hypothetical protein